jgi:DNA helicase-2/ATP-dependent DNA helicase PcrA
VSLFEALRNASRVGEVSARAAAAIGKFVGMVVEWREAASGGEESLMPQADRAPLAELVARIVRESGLEAMYAKSKSEEDWERLQNIEELINAAADFVPVDDEPTSQDNVLDLLQTWLESIALVSDSDAIDPEKGAVTLMTLHAAKGLEFEAVALAGMEEGLLPHSRSLGSDLELEEERRLCFVGITRAKRHLVMTRAAMRTVRGIPERTVPSTFLRELPPEDVIFNDHTGESAFDDESGDNSAAVEWGRSSYDAVRPTRTRPTATVQRNASDEFPVGCLVQHPKFGLGRVELVTRRVSGSSAQVAFASVGRKTLILEFAKLQRIDD